MVLLVAGIALAIALWGHDANDPSLNHATSGASTNPLGHFGASVADMSKQTIGLPPGSCRWCWRCGACA